MKKNPKIGRKRTHKVSKAVASKRILAKATEDMEKAEKVFQPVQNELAYCVGVACKYWGKL